MSTTLRLRNAADTYVFETHTDRNYGSKGVLKANATASAVKYGYLHFPLRLPESATILDAELRLYVKGGWTGAATVTARRVTARWKEDRLTYTGAPATTATNAATGVGTTTPAEGDIVTFDVTAIVTDWVSGQANYGLRISTTFTTSDLTFYAGDYGDSTVRPTLVVSYALEPDAPVNLSPDGGQAVGDSTPLLTWDSETPSYVYIQADDSSAFGTPIWDTGWVAWTDLAYDTAALTALTDNTTYYWRVKVKNGDGIASDWSQAAEFQYRSQGSLAISAPAGSTVTTPRPTITWALTSRTQAFYRVIVHEDGDQVYDSGRIAGATTSLQVPAGVFDEGAASYDIYVLTWDTFDRVSAGDSKAYVKASKTGVTQTTGATTAPTSVTAASDGAMGVTIGWSAAAAPDAFVITRGTKVVVDDLDPADALVSGTTYSWTVYEGIPWKGSTDTWGVQSEVAGVISTKATATYAFEPRGIGLVDETDGTTVRLLGQEAISANLGESGATFYPLGRRDPVRIVDSARGLEGTVSGLLYAWKDITAATAIASLWTIYERALAGRELRLIAGHWNLPVRVSNVQVQQEPSGEEAYRVSFDFVQTGEFDTTVEV